MHPSRRFSCVLVAFVLVGCSTDPTAAPPADSGATAVDSGLGEGGGSTEKDASPSCETKNLCGGCSELPGEVGAPCVGPLGAVWQCDGTESVSCITPDAPTSVAASTDDFAAVHVRWSPPTTGMPTGYTVLRDDEPIATDVTALSFDDANARSGALNEPTGVAATKGTWGGGVRVTWAPPAGTAGQPHRYTVRAQYPAWTSLPSAGADGVRGVPAVTRYEVEVAGVWTPATTALSYDDTTLPRVALVDRSATPVVADITAGAVRLDASVEAVPGPSATYRVRAIAGDLFPFPSKSVTGFRGGGATVEVRWQRSTTDSNADYTYLPDGTGVSSYDDTGPLDGSGRYYRAILHSEGGDGITTGSRATLTGFTQIAMTGISTCGIRSTDGAIVCWGSASLVRTEGAPYARIIAGGDRFCAFGTTGGAPYCFSLVNTPVDPPPARSFASIDLRAECGLTTAGEALCWDPASTGPAPPSEPLRAVSFLPFGGGCGIGLNDGAARCWGWSGVPADPLLDIVTVPAGVAACGRRVSDRVAICWAPYDSSIPAPTEPMKEIAADRDLVCGIREVDDRVVCWSIGGSSATLFGLAGPSRDRFRDLRVQGLAVCGTRLDDGDFVCRGDFSRFWLPPSRSTALGLTVACALDDNGRIRCVGNGTSFLFPKDHFDRFAIGGQHACGVRTDGGLGCISGATDADPPPGLGIVSGFAASSTSACAIRASDGKSICWAGWTDADRSPVVSIDGFSALAAGPDEIDGIRAADGSLAQVFTRYLGDTMPVGSYAALSNPGDHACALRRDDHKAVCWGTNTDGQAPPGPSDEVYDEIATGYRTTCAVRHDDHRLRCWGKDQPVTPSAFAVTSPAIGASVCAVRESDHAGFCGTSLWQDTPATTTLGDAIRSFVFPGGNFKPLSTASMCFVKADGHLGCR